MRKPFPGWETGNLFGVALARVTKERTIKRKEERHVTSLFVKLAGRISHVYIVMYYKILIVAEAFVCFAYSHLLSEAIIMGGHIT